MASPLYRNIPTSLVRVLTLAGLFSLVGTVVGQLLGAFWWPFELACHFTMYYAIALVILTPVLLWKSSHRNLLFGSCCLAGLLWNLILLGPYMPARVLGQSSGKTLRVMTLNVLTHNHRYQDVLRMVDQEAPDVLALVEVNQAWIDAMAPLAEQYNTIKAHPQPDNFGIALYSRLPVDEVQVVDFGQSTMKCISADFQFEDEVVHLLAIHPLPPTNSFNAGSRNRQLAASADWAAEQEGPTIVLGDMNISPWSPQFRSMTSRSGLRKSGGVRPTWYVARVVGLPIDHVLHSRELSVVGHRVGPYVGSDHRAVIVDLMPKRERARHHP